MAKRGVKVKEHERLEDANVKRVIDLLEGEQPITKKAACEILNISYNTKRLDSIITEYKERTERRKRNFAKNRGKPITDSEIARMVNYHLSGDPIATISELTFRSPSVVKTVLERVGVPFKPKGDEAHKPAFLPDDCIMDEAHPGQIVWSAKYHAPAEVIKFQGLSRDSQSKVYQVYVIEASDERKKGGFYASQRIEELGSLEHLKKYINLEQLSS